MANLVLLGDSLIKTSAYLERDWPDTHEQIAALLPDVTVTVRIVEGSASLAMTNQFAEVLLPDDAAVFVGFGGDLMAPILGLGDLEQRDFAETMAMLNATRRLFLSGFDIIPDDGYASFLDALKGRRVLVSTIYTPNLTGEERELQPGAAAALSLYNDAIQQEALARGFDILELRDLFTGSSDYAGALEPSAAGSAKVALAVVDWMESAE